MRLHGPAGAIPRRSMSTPRTPARRAPSQSASGESPQCSARAGGDTQDSQRVQEDRRVGLGGADAGARADAAKRWATPSSARTSGRLQSQLLTTATDDARALQRVERRERRRARG